MSDKKLKRVNTKLGNNIGGLQFGMTVIFIPLLLCVYNSDFFLPILVFWIGTFSIELGVDIYKSSIPKNFIYYFLDFMSAFSSILLLYIITWIYKEYNSTLMVPLGTSPEGEYNGLDINYYFANLAFMYFLMITVVTYTIDIIVHLLKLETYRYIEEGDINDRGTED